MFIANVKSLNINAEEITDLSLKINTFHTVLMNRILIKWRLWRYKD